MRDNRLGKVAVVGRGEVRLNEKVVQEHQFDCVGRLRTHVHRYPPDVRLPAFSLGIDTPILHSGRPVFDEVKGLKVSKDVLVLAFYLVNQTELVVEKHLALVCEHHTGVAQLLAVGVVAGEIHARHDLLDFPRERLFANFLVVADIAEQQLWLEARVHVTQLFHHFASQPRKAFFGKFRRVRGLALNNLDFELNPLQHAVDVFNERNTFLGADTLCAADSVDRGHQVAHVYELDELVVQ